MTNEKTKKYLAMSPFELKNVLIETAQKSAAEHGGKMLNAGRGNPNFLNTTVREAFSYLNLFVTGLAAEKTSINDLGFRPEKKGIAKKLDAFLKKANAGKATEFLNKAVKFAEKEYGLDPDEFVFEISDAALGDFYPSPSRIFPCTEKIVNAYLTQILCPGGHPAKGKFDLFAVEGATAAMVYIFNSLKENKILHYGDHIAIITPIFSPYLEIPHLSDYRLVEMFVEQNEDMEWQLPDSEVEKLKDRKIKALFMVHPTNPTSVKFNEKTMKKIAEVVKNDREDLIVLTDTVYATFVDGFHSLVEVLPHNTICCYSYSKYFGVTGWRLGVIMLHEHNIIDKKIKELSAHEIAELDKKYKMDSATPEKIKFIDRLEMDSRDVALAHTGGLSCPQQAIMCLFSLFNLMDDTLKYKKSIQATLRKRIKNLYDNLGIKLTEGPDHTYYYSLVDIGKMAKEKYGEAFAKELCQDHIMIEFLFKLAKEKLTICLPGAGFRGPKWSLRVSLANLDDDAYTTIGRNINDVMKEYYEVFAKASR